MSRGHPAAPLSPDDDFEDDSLYDTAAPVAPPPPRRRRLDVSDDERTPWTPYGAKVAEPCACGGTKLVQVNAGGVVPCPRCS